jgi:tRNA A37 N6-isopentenylltransferase MiaA
MMLTQGLLEEVVFLVRQCGLKPDSPAGRSIGYRQALEYLTSCWGLSSDDHVIKDVSVEMMRSQFIDFLLKYQSQTRQLARHQLTWFKKDPRFHWINMAVAPDGVSSLDSIAQHVMNWFQFDISLPPELHGDNLKILVSHNEIFHATFKHH